MGVAVNEFNEMRDLEVITFRRTALEVIQATIAERDPSPESRSLYYHPPYIDSSGELPVHLQDKVNNGKD